MKISIIMICLISVLILSSCGQSKNIDINNTDASDSLMINDKSEEKDTTPPEIVCSADAIGYVMGCENDYISIVTATDGSEEDVSLEVDDSQVDIEKVGKYTVEFTATDKSGNKSSLERPVYVVKNPSSSEIMKYISKDIMADDPQIVVQTHSGEEFDEGLQLSIKKKHNTFQL